MAGVDDLRPAPVLSGLRPEGLAETLARDGYANLGPFLGRGAVADARAAFAEAADRFGRPLGDRWFPTILLPDDEVRAFITGSLESLVVPRLDELLDPTVWDLLRLDYSVKPASPASGLGPHQDFSLVDEGVATSLYLWIPLEDTDERNGTLHVVPGSHRFANAVRSQHVPAYFDDVLDLVHEDAVRLDCGSGDLVVMVSGVIHFSPPNRGDGVRLVVHGIVTPADVPLVFFYADEATPAGEVECFEVDLETYVRHIHRGRPGPEVPRNRFQARPPARMSRDRFTAGMAAVRAQG
jgi:hypothetical protein